MSETMTGCASLPVSCRSNLHATAVPATVTGTFDPTNINGNPPEPGSYYCTSCANYLAMAGCFTVDPVDTR